MNGPKTRLIKSLLSLVQKSHVGTNLHRLGALVAFMSLRLCVHGNILSSEYVYQAAHM